MLFRSIVLAEGHFSRQQLFSIDRKPTSLTGRRVTSLYFIVASKERRADWLLASCPKNHLTRLMSRVHLLGVPTVVNTF